MAKKRLWIALVAISITLASLLVVGAQKPRLANAGGIIDPACSSSLPCIEYDNNATGPGVRGVSLSGNGLVGFTKFRSTSALNGRAGLGGNDLSSSGTFNAGVRGISVRGTGVTGNSTSGPGVSGTSTNSVGVQGASSNSVGVLGTSDISDAVRGIVGSGRAASFHAGVAGLDSSTSGTTNEGVYGQSTNGIGVQGVSLGQTAGVQATGGGTTGGNSYPALSVNGTHTFSDLIDACNTSGPNPCGDVIGSTGAVFRLEYTGDVIIAGRIFTAGSCSSGCVSSPLAGQKRVRLFTPQESLPTVEDFGSERLVNGQAYVRIDPAFANTIDPGANYLVFITPEGDSRGLYVTGKTLAGFAVHENQGGRSTLAFSYRIVAKPFGEHAVRLQMFATTKSATYPKQPVRLR